MLMNPDATDTLEHPIDKIPDEGKNNFDPVSYTHIDVYKRQGKMARAVAYSSK